MKVRGSEAPQGKYSIEGVPGKALSLVRMYENVHEYSEVREDGETESGWEWDEYHVEQIPWDGLSQNVEDNYQVFLDAGKAAEVDTSNAALYAAQRTAERFIYADQYKRWDGLKWVYDPANPIPLLRFPFPVEPNAIYRTEDGVRYVGVKAGRVTEETLTEYLEPYELGG